MRRFALLLLASCLALAACGGDDGGSGGGGDDGDATISAEDAEPTGPAPEGIEGVLAWDITDNSHVEGRVDYRVSPPVAGPHNPVWANCGFHEGEIPSENAVHSLEHGVVWFTFTEDADDATLDTIRGFVDQSDHILASLYPDQDAPLVMTAWNRQLQLETVDDPRVVPFLETYLLADTAPEPGASCSGGAG